jgi:hypothetical protein
MVNREPGNAAADYAILNSAAMNPGGRYTAPLAASGADTSQSEGDQKAKSRNQKRLMWVWLLASSVVILLIASCFIALFIQVSELRSKFSGSSEFSEPLVWLHPSCAALRPSSLSGYYWVRASNGSAVRVYCDMTRLCGNITGGWMRVAELDMTNSSHQCPSGLRPQRNVSVRTCVKDTDPGGCSSVTISSATVEYSRVCGKIIAYQFGKTEAFATFVGDPAHYIDGVSLVHGNLKIL